MATLTLTGETITELQIFGLLRATRDAARGRDLTTDEARIVRKCNLAMSNWKPGQTHARVLGARTFVADALNARMVVLKCAMVATCAQPITYIDEKGWVYCTSHGVERQAHRRCRKLRPHEIKTLTAGRPIAKY